MFRRIFVTNGQEIEMYHKTFMKRETNQMHINRVLLNIVRENMDHREIFVLAVEVRWKIHQRI